MEPLDEAVSSLTRILSPCKGDSHADRSRMTTSMESSDTILLWLRSAAIVVLVAVLLAGDLVFSVEVDSLQEGLALRIFSGATRLRMPQSLRGESGGQKSRGEAGGVQGDMRTTGDRGADCEHDAVRCKTGTARSPLPKL